MPALYPVLLYLLSIAQWLVLGQVLMSWLVNFQVLNLRQPIVYQIWHGLNQLLEPIYSRVRRFIPSVQGLDLAPFFVLIVINVLSIALASNRMAFY
jgi:YggT family protein